MYKMYIPTNDELEMVKLKKFLYRLNCEPSDQDELIGALTHAIMSFDYFYHYSDSYNTWRNGEKESKCIREKIEEVIDPVIRQHFSSHFNSIDCQKVGDIFPWKKYIYQSTKYVRLRWSGKTEEEASKIIGIKTWLETLNHLSRRANLYDRVLYSNDFESASRLLREGLKFKYDKDNLCSAATPAFLHNELTEFTQLYMSGGITYSELREALTVFVETLFGSECEILHIKDFYIIIIHK